MTENPEGSSYVKEVVAFPQKFRFLCAMTAINPIQSAQKAVLEACMRAHLTQFC